AASPRPETATGHPACTPRGCRRRAAAAAAAYRSCPGSCRASDLLQLHFAPLGRALIRRLDKPLVDDGVLPVRRGRLATHYARQELLELEPEWIAQLQVHHLPIRQ